MNAEFFKALDMLEKEKELALQRPNHACGAWEAI